MARTDQKRTSNPERPASRGVSWLPESLKRKPRGSDDLRFKILRGAGIFFLCALVAALGFAAGGYLGLVKAVDKLKKPTYVSTQPTYIYSAPLGKTEGSRRVIGTIFEGKNHRTASLSEMPPDLLNALVVKEDRRFREHGGVDLWGIMRALYADIRAGKAVEGASTITQQFVRNAYLNQAPTITRKIREALISIEIERRYSKDQILADCLNTVYFGNNAYGVEAASETYFSKSVQDLTTAESATLVGLLWSPSSLGKDEKAAKAQRNLVLGKMFDAGYITKQDYKSALHEPMPKKWPENPMNTTGLTGPSSTRDFTEMVEQRLVDKYGAATVLRGGLSVYTTLSLKDQVYAQNLLYGPNGYLSNPNYPDAALVSIDPNTGHIEAMVGGRNQNSDFNLVTQGQRQPGSSFKPFALIAALEQGISPKRKFVSEKKVYHIKKPGGGTEKWKVENYEGIERGRITLQDALWQSDNTVFTDLATNANGRGLKNGPEKIVEVAKKLGIQAKFKKHPNPSVVLGTQVVSPLDMARAYATIANEGRRVQPRAITKVVQNEGQKDQKVLYSAPKNPKGKQVIPKKIAREAISLMMGDINQGIASKASLGDRVAAGKTGTSENFFDSWFIGFTPQLTTAVWMGYSQGGKTLEGLIGPEAEQIGNEPTPTIIWHDYMQHALQGEPKKKFKGVTPTPPDPTNGFYGPPGTQ